MLSPVALLTSAGSIIGEKYLKLLYSTKHQTGEDTSGFKAATAFSDRMKCSNPQSLAERIGPRASYGQRQATRMIYGRNCAQ